MRRTLLVVRGAGVPAVVAPVEGDLNRLRGRADRLRRPAVGGPVSRETWARDPLLRRDGYDYLERILLDGAFIRRGRPYEDLVDSTIARRVMAEAS